MDSVKINQEIIKALQANFPHGAKDVIEAGFRLEEQEADSTFPDGWTLVYRNFDNKCIGRINQVERQSAIWNGRYYFWGGGTTFGGFATKWMAAQWILMKNSGLGTGWDE